MNTSSPTPLLLCPSCLKEIPLINIHIDHQINQVMVNISCNCHNQSQSQVKSLPLDKYFSIIKSKSKSVSSFQCHKHSSSKSISYCSNCFIWMCPICVINHQDSHASHVVLSNELHLSCIHHKSNLIVYCHQCRMIICRHCKEKDHKTHKTDEVKENIGNGLQCFLKDFGQIQAVIEENAKAFATFEQLVHARIQQLNQWLREVKELHDWNAMINGQLNDLCSVMITTGSLMKDVVNYPINRLFEGIMINKPSEVVFEKGKTEKGYEMLKERYRQMFILKFNDSMAMVKTSAVNEDKKINRRTYKCLKAFKAHDHPINCIEQLTNGKFISGALDGSLCIWDLSIFKCLSTFTNPSSVNCVLQLENSSIMTGYADGSIRINEILTITPDSITLPLMGLLKGHNDSVNCLSKLKGKRVASGSSDRTVKIWDLTSQDCLFTITGHRNEILMVIQLKDSRLVTASNDHSIKLWTDQGFEYITTLTEHKFSVCTVIQLKDSRLVSASSDCSIIVWDAKSLEIAEVLKGHSNTVYAICQLDDDRLASASGDLSIKLWDVLTMKCIVTMDGVHTEMIYALVQLKDGRLAAASWDKTISLWDV